MNKYSKNIVTLGVGYTAKFWYIDIAYMYQTQKADFYPFDYGNKIPVTKVKTVGNSIIAGVGFCF